MISKTCTGCGDTISEDHDNKGSLDDVCLHCEEDAKMYIKCKQLAEEAGVDLKKAVQAMSRNGGSYNLALKDLRK